MQCSLPFVARWTTRRRKNNGGCRRGSSGAEAGASGRKGHRLKKIRQSHKVYWKKMFLHRLTVDVDTARLNPEKSC